MSTESERIMNTAAIYLKQILNRNHNGNLQKFLTNEKRLKLARNLVAIVNSASRKRKALNNYRNTVKWYKRPFRPFKPKNVVLPNYTKINPELLRKYIIRLNHRASAIFNSGRGTRRKYTNETLPNNNKTFYYI
jgi:hypothetical protein